MLVCCAAPWWTVAVGEEAEAALCAELARALGRAKGDKAAEARIWDEEWRGVYDLAEAVMARPLRMSRPTQEGGAAATLQCIGSQT